ncbi:hypothetical protein HS088_TW18G00655 [Tripterygium wilfordii]|uniref:pectinesterase n=1 Tax=Tripterygium wilfordii TaxID=458696 RepID=A0A7J7CCV0_TRIWF|nr:pectinesterase-like [Tripterygium wilfordii]XP_038683634.1 pectinesterase-like [Tripterygium wilfordii]KAF5731968.1 hypothetical protein HS088_TW18G00655 [Tripterygium wilfordii]
MKAVTQMCSPTDYKEACMKSLRSANNTDPKELFKAAIMATTEAVKKSLNISDSIVVDATKEPRIKMAVDDCKDLMDFAVQELQASFSSVGDSQMHTMQDRVADLKNWFSAVISYQQSCLDGFDDPTKTEPNQSHPVKDQLSNGMIDASQLTSNVLAIVDSLGSVLEKFNLKLNLPRTNRRLLEADGYPSWFSGADRKLLAKVDNGGIRPNAVVAKDGSGQFKTISAALAAYPKNLRGRYVIYVKAGIYDEYITIDKKTVNVFMYGDGPRKTIVTGSKSYSKGFGTMQTASFSAVGEGFMAKSMGFQNTAGPQGHQAVALRVQSDRSVFFNCRIDGHQDTLYYHAHRQFYRNCVISGTIDFIFDYGAAVIQNSLIILRRPMDNQFNTVTADGRADRHLATGLVIHNCRIVPEQKLVADRFKIPSYLGRPWKEYSRTVIMESTIGDAIKPEGWFPWAGNFALDTLYYAEYANRGPGARLDRRVRWKGFRGAIPRREALQFTVDAFIQGNQWIRGTGVPMLAGLKH